MSPASCPLFPERGFLLTDEADKSPATPSTAYSGVKKKSFHRSQGSDKCHVPTRGFLWRMWLRGLRGWGRAWRRRGRVCGSQEEGRAGEGPGQRRGQDSSGADQKSPRGHTGPGEGQGRGEGFARAERILGWGSDTCPRDRAQSSHSTQPTPRARLQEVPAVRVSPALSWPVTGREDHRLTAFLGSSPGPGSWAAGVTHKGRMRYQGHGSSFIHERGGHGKTLRKYNSAATGSIKGLHPHLNQRAEPACASLAGSRYWGGWGLGK